MNQKEVGELRRRWQPDKNSVGHIYGCYVNKNGEILSDLDEPLSVMPQEEAEKYFELLKKSLSGKLGKNLIDIVFSTQQMTGSEEHKLLSALRETELKDNETRQRFYQKAIDSLDMDSPYLLLMAFDSYDVPYRGKDDNWNVDASDEVFRYFLCCVCPVKDSKTELGYFPGKNEFHCAAGQVVAAPELGFLFSAFDDRAANLYNALFYSRKPDEIHQEFIDGIFHTEPPMSAAEQKELFQSALTEALEDFCDMETVQTVHSQLAGKINEHKESKNPEPLTMTAGEIAGILRDCDVPQEKIETFQKRYDEEFGAGSAVDPANLVDPGKFEVKTSQATITVDPEYSFLVKTQVIDGRKYLLIPAEDGMEVNGLPVKLGAIAGNDKS